MSLGRFLIYCWDGSWLIVFYKVEELKREAEIAQAKANRYRKLHDESRDQIASFEPEREMFFPLVPLYIEPVIYTQLLLFTLYFLAPSQPIWLSAIAIPHSVRLSVRLSVCTSVNI